MRNNLITSIAIGVIPACITDLDLNENQITKIEGLTDLVNLETLDLSYNRFVIFFSVFYILFCRVSEIEGLENCTKMTHLYLVGNKIREIKGLDNLVNLELLELGDNKYVRIFQCFIFCL